MKLSKTAVQQLFTVAFFMVLCIRHCFAQGFLDRNKEEITLSYPQCTVADNYDKMMVLSCNGLRTIFYFKNKNGLCDLYASEMDIKSAQDTLQSVIKDGFKLIETKYVESFLLIKKGTHQKFPSRVYSNGKVEYCFMPVSLNGRTADLNSVIIRFARKDQATAPVR